MQLAQRAPLDILHDKEERGLAVVLGRIDVERAHDVLVADALAHLRLAQESLEEAGRREQLRDGRA